MSKDLFGEQSWEMLLVRTYNLTKMLIKKRLIMLLKLLEEECINSHQVSRRMILN